MSEQSVFKIGVLTFNRSGGYWRITHEVLGWTCDFYKLPGEWLEEILDAYATLLSRCADQQKVIQEAEAFNESTGMWHDVHLALEAYRAAYPEPLGAPESPEPQESE